MKQKIKGLLGKYNSCLDVTEPWFKKLEFAAEEKATTEKILRQCEQLDKLKESQHMQLLAQQKLSKLSTKTHGLLEIIRKARDSFLSDFCLFI